MAIIGSWYLILTKIQSGADKHSYVISFGTHHFQVPRWISQVCISISSQDIHFTWIVWWLLNVWWFQHTFKIVSKNFPTYPWDIPKRPPTKSLWRDSFQLGVWGFMGYAKQGYVWVLLDCWNAAFSNKHPLKVGWLLDVEGKESIKPLVLNIEVLLMTEILYQLKASLYHFDPFFTRFWLRFQSSFFEVSPVWGNSRIKIGPGTKEPSQQSKKVWFSHDIPFHICPVQEISQLNYSTCVGYKYIIKSISLKQASCFKVDPYEPWFNCEVNSWLRYSLSGSNITPPKTNMSPKKGPFQKKISSSNHQFSGDMLFFNLVPLKANK